MSGPIANLVRPEILAASSQITASGETSSVDLKEAAHQGIQVKAGAVDAIAAGVNDLEFKLQHSDDDSVWSDVDYAPSSLASAELANVGDILRIPYEGDKRYLRLAYVATGSPDLTVDAVAILQDQHLVEKG